MTKSILYFLTTMFLAGLFTGCSTDSKSVSYFFEGDIQTLLIQENEVPSGWRFYRSFSAPQTEDMIAHLGVVYGSRDTLDQRATIINHSVGVLKEEEVAMQLFDYNYDFDSVIEPPQEYHYRSPLADEFKIICTSINNNLDGLFIGYDCLYSARYGNVISDLIVNIEREDGVKAKEANLLSWAEVEQLLKLIDDKFQKAGFGE